MKLFGRTGGYYLFWTGFVYFWLGMFDIFVYRFCPLELLNLAWVCIIMIPLVVPPVARYFNMEPLMFDFFRSKTAKDYLDETKNNVYNLPKPTLVPPMPPVEPPQRDATAYRIGKTEDGKVTLSLGDYTSTVVTMNNAGVDQLIRMLEAAKDINGDE